MVDLNEFALEKQCKYKDRIYEYDIKVKQFFLLAAIIMENVKFYPHLVADYVKYMLKITFDLYCL